jgi:GTPase SAR1 family protein
MSTPITYLDPFVSQEYEHLFKCLLLGNSGCGKSSIVDRFVDPQHILRTNYITTIGVDFKVQSFLWDGRIVKLQVTILPTRPNSSLSLRFGTQLDKKDSVLL